MAKVAKPTRLEYLLTRLNHIEGMELRRLADSPFVQARGYELDRPYDKESTADLLTLGFMWTSTPQGFHFWNQIHEKYQQKEMVHGIR